MTKARRLIAAVDGGGKSVFTRVEEVEPLVAGAAVWGVWGADEPPRLPFAATEPYELESFIPDRDGVRITFTEFPPEEAPNLLAEQFGGRDDSDEFARLQMAGDKMLGYDAETGLHATASMDVAFVVRGEIDVELDDGASETLRQGDCLVQYGNRHAWHNRSGEPCLVGFVILGVTEEKEDG